MNRRKFNNGWKMYQKKSVTQPVKWQGIWWKEPKRTLRRLKVTPKNPINWLDSWISCHIYLKVDVLANPVRLDCKNYRTFSIRAFPSQLKAGDFSSGKFSFVEFQITDKFHQLPPWFLQLKFCNRVNKSKCSVPKVLMNWDEDSEFRAFSGLGITTHLTLMTLNNNWVTNR